MGLMHLGRRPHDLWTDPPAGGASIAEIASTLFLSEGTVRNYLSEAIQKLEARNRVEAAHIALEKGWL
jgi:two-component system response regulator DesR